MIYDLQYGVTDKLTVGIHIPYWFQKNEVDARVDTATARHTPGPVIRA